MKPKAANAAFLFQSTCSRFSITFWTSKSLNDVLNPDRTMPNAMGYLAGTAETFDQSDAEGDDAEAVGGTDTEENFAPRSFPLDNNDDDDIVFKNICRVLN
jgi:hypothetical protein